MAFRIEFYNFMKKENSTKLPSGASESFDCVIKRGSPLLNPHIELNIGLTQAPTWNYCYIPNFGRYYWITEWTFEGALWTAECKVDALATYRTEIGNEDLYALRSSHTYDGDIVDSLYPRKANHQLTHIPIVMPWEEPTRGCFVVGITNNEPSFGTVSYYVLDSDTMKHLITMLLDDNFLSGQGFNIQDASWHVMKNLMNPLQYITSAIFLPIDYNSIPGDNTPYVEIFDMKLRVPARGHAKIVRPSQPSVGGVINIRQIPVHPMTQSRGRYVNCAQYTTYTLAIPPFGVFPIDANALVTENSIAYDIDLATGLGIITVFINDGVYQQTSRGFILNQLEAQIGVPVQLSQVTVDYIGFATATVDTVAGITSGIGGAFAAASTGNIGGAFAAAGNGRSQTAHGIADGLAALTPRSNTIGSGGSYSQLYQEAGIYADFAIPVDDDIEKNGRPLCRVIKPKNYQGYLLIQDGDVPISGTQEEAQLIKAYLQTGFYYE